MDTPQKRLKWAREQAGFATAADAARAMGMAVPTYQGHENSSRGFKAHAEQYARRFHVTLDWLLDARGEPWPRYSETEIALIDALRGLPENEAAAYAELLLSRRRAG